MPQMHRRPTDVQEPGRLGGAAAGIQREEDVRAARLAARHRRSSQLPFQSLPVIRGQLEIRGRLHDGHGTKISR